MSQCIQGRGQTKMNIYKLIDELNETVAATRKNPNYGYHLNYNELLHEIIKSCRNSFWKGFSAGIMFCLVVMIIKECMRYR